MMPCGIHAETVIPLNPAPSSITLLDCDVLRENLPSGCAKRGAGSFFVIPAEAGIQPCEKRGMAVAGMTKCWCHGRASSVRGPMRRMALQYRPVLEFEAGFSPTCSIQAQDQALDGIAEPRGVDRHAVKGRAWNRSCNSWGPAPRLSQGSPRGIRPRNGRCWPRSTKSWTCFSSQCRLARARRQRMQRGGSRDIRQIVWPCPFPS